MLGVGVGVGVGVGDGEPVGLGLVVRLLDPVGLALDVVVGPLPCLPPGWGPVLPCAVVVAVVVVPGAGFPAAGLCFPLCPGRDPGDAAPWETTTEAPACGPCSSP